MFYGRDSVRLAVEHQRTCRSVKLLIERRAVPEVALFFLLWAGGQCLAILVLLECDVLSYLNITFLAVTLFTAVFIKKPSSEI